jgi:hypothetical protein
MQPHAKITNIKNLLCCSVRVCLANAHHLLLNCIIIVVGHFEVGLEYEYNVDDLFVHSNCSFILHIHTLGTIFDVIRYAFILLGAYTSTRVRGLSQRHSAVCKRARHAWLTSKNGPLRLQTVWQHIAIRSLMNWTL